MGDVNLAQFVRMQQTLPLARPGTSPETAELVRKYRQLTLSLMYMEVLSRQAVIRAEDIHHRDLTENPFGGMILDLLDQTFSDLHNFHGHERYAPEGKRILRTYGGNWGNFYSTLKYGPEQEKHRVKTIGDLVAWYDDPINRWSRQRKEAKYFKDAVAASFVSAIAEAETTLQRDDSLVLKLDPDSGLWEEGIFYRDAQMMACSGCWIKVTASHPYFETVAQKIEREIEHANKRKSD